MLQVDTSAVPQVPEKDAQPFATAVARTIIRPVTERHERLAGLTAAIVYTDWS